MSGMDGLDMKEGRARLVLCLAARISITSLRSLLAMSITQSEQNQSTSR